jgi:hypothetical protein
VSNASPTSRPCDALALGLHQARAVFVERGVDQVGKLVEGEVAKV